MPHYGNRINFTPGSMNHTVWLGVFWIIMIYIKHTHSWTNEWYRFWQQASQNDFVLKRPQKIRGRAVFDPNESVKKISMKCIFNFRSKMIQLSVQTNPCTQQMPKYCSNCSNQLILIYLANFFTKNLTKLHMTHRRAKIPCQAKMVKNAPIM